MNLPSGESLVRQIVFGQRYFEEKFGQRCEEVWIPDVFGYPAGLPQVFAAGGMRRFVTQKLSWNKQNRFPHSTFWWEGLDGTRVLTHFPPVDTYNAEITPAEVAYSVRNFQRPRLERVVADAVRARRRRRWTDPGDARAGAPAGVDRPEADGRRRHARRVLRSRSRRRSPPVRRCPCGAASCTSRRTAARSTSQLRTKLGNRRCERLLVEAELWAATLGRPADVDDLWREVLTQQFHDILPGSSIAWVHADAEAVFERVAAELEERIAAPARRDRAATGPDALANPADAPVDGVVVLGCGRRHSPTSSTGGQRLADGRLAVGRRPSRRSACAALRVALDRRPRRAVRHVDDELAPGGAVGPRRQPHARSSISCRPASCVPAGTLGAVLELAPDHPVEYDAWDLESWTRRQGRAAHRRRTMSTVEITDAGPLIGRVVVRRTFGPSSSTVTYELRGRAPRSCSCTSTSTGTTTSTCCRWPSRSTCAPTRRAATCSSASVARPTHPSNPWDAAKFEVCAHRFVDVSEPDFGVADPERRPLRPLRVRRSGSRQPGPRREVSRSGRRSRPSLGDAGGAAARWRSGPACATRPPG